MRVKQLAHNGPLRSQLQQLYILAVAATDNEPPALRGVARCLTERGARRSPKRVGSTHRLPGRLRPSAVPGEIYAQWTRVIYTGRGTCYQSSSFSG